jgi:hypothetical protein
VKRSALLAPLAILLSVLSLAACGITAPRGSEGFADLDSLGLTDTDRVLKLSFGPTVLNFAARHSEGDPDAQALLRGLDGVRIRVYEIDGDATRVAARMHSMSEKLVAGGWERVMLVRSAGEQAHMLIRFSDERICGMTVLVSDGESEAVVINLMGEIQPRQFSEVMVALDVDAAGVEEVQPRNVQES